MKVSKFVIIKILEKLIEVDDIDIIKCTLESLIDLIKDNKIDNNQGD